MPTAEPELAGEFDSRLFRHLNALRLRIALEENVPPHAVLHKFSLQEMTVKQPQARDALRIEIARADAVSPLAVFPDRTLIEMTVLLPRTLDALRSATASVPTSWSATARGFWTRIAPPPTPDRRSDHCIGRVVPPARPIRRIGPLLKADSKIWPHPIPGDGILLATGIAPPLAP
ncbi:MAG: HRDC domain-containing protein [Boseongicola sp.]|nr:HRDC domain-containing protein [Boseongicola sp.]